MFCFSLWLTPGPLNFSSILPRPTNCLSNLFSPASPLAHTRIVLDRRTNKEKKPRFHILKERVVALDHQWGQRRTVICAALFASRSLPPVAYHSPLHYLILESCAPCTQAPHATPSGKWRASLSKHFAWVSGLIDVMLSPMQLR